MIMKTLPMLITMVMKTWFEPSHVPSIYKTSFILGSQEGLSGVWLVSAWVGAHRRGGMGDEGRYLFESI